MRIAYYFHSLEGVESGVFKKISGQISFWIGRGHTVALFLLSERGSILAQQLGAIDRVYPIIAETYGSQVNRFRRVNSLVKAISEWVPDLTYIRYDLYYPALAGLARKHPMVIEVNTNDLVEYHINGTWYRGWYNRLTRGLLFRRCDGMVYVSGEFPHLPQFARYKKSHIVVGNGIDLRSHPTLPVPNNPEPRLVFLAYGDRPWNGTDKVIDLARMVPEWIFDLIGLTRNDLKADIPANVTLWGKLDRAGYQAIIAQADVALGTLAYHRNGFVEASPLKVREYLAYGIPTIIGYRDTDFLKPPDFILQLPNSPGNVAENITVIKQFVATWKGKRILRRHVGHLDLNVKENVRLDYLRQIVASGKRLRFGNIK